MVSIAAQATLRLIGWTFLPDMGSRIALKLYRHARQHLLPQLGFKSVPPPPPKSIDDRAQQQTSFALVVLVYLMWNTAQSYANTQPSFYSLLDVRPNADDATLRTAFRNFARYNHPDIIGPQGEPRFIATREAFDALKSHTVRFAYDRFGPEVTKWANECETVTDYLHRGLLGSVGYYLFTSVAMLFYAVFGSSGFGAYWRNNLYLGMIAVELSLILGPKSRWLFWLFPGRVQFQHISFLHNVFLSVSIAITRIGPAAFPSLLGDRQEEWQAERQQMYNLVHQVSETKNRLDRELTRLIQTEIRAAHGAQYDPFSNDDSFASTPGTPGLASTSRTTSSTSLHTPHSSQQSSSGLIDMTTPSKRASTPTYNNDIMITLSDEMENLIVERNLRRHPMLGALWKEGLSKRKSHLPAHSSSPFTIPSPRMASLGPFGSNTQAKEQYLKRRAKSEGSVASQSAGTEFLAPGSSSSRRISAERAKRREDMLDRLGTSGSPSPGPSLQPLTPAFSTNVSSSPRTVLSQQFPGIRNSSARARSLSLVG